MSLRGSNKCLDPSLHTDQIVQLERSSKFDSGKNSLPAPTELDFYISIPVPESKMPFTLDFSKIIDDYFKRVANEKDEQYTGGDDIHSKKCLKRKISNIVDGSFFVAGLYLYLIRHLNLNKIRDLNYIHDTSKINHEEITNYYSLIADFLIRNNLHSSFCIFMSEIFPVLKNNIRFLALWGKLRDVNSLNSSKLLLAECDIENILLSLSFHPIDASEFLNICQENHNETLLSLLFTFCSEKYMNLKVKFEENQTHIESEKLQINESVQNINLKLKALNVFYEKMKQNYEILLKQKDIKKRKEGEFRKVVKGCDQLHQDKAEQTEEYVAFLPKNAEDSAYVKFMERKQNYLLKKKRWKIMKRPCCLCKCKMLRKNYNYISKISAITKKYNLAKDTDLIQTSISKDEPANKDVIQINNLEKIQEQTRIEDITKENQELRKINFELLKRLDRLSIKLYETNEKLLLYTSNINNDEDDEQVITSEKVFDNLEAIKTKDKGIAVDEENIKLPKNVLFGSSIKKFSEIKTKEKQFSTLVKSKVVNCKYVMPYARQPKRMSELMQINVESKKKLLETCSSIENIKSKLEELKLETLNVTVDYQNLVKKNFHLRKEKKVIFLTN